MSLKHSASSAAHAAPSSASSTPSVRHHPGSSFILYASSPANSIFVRPRSSSMSSSVASPARSSMFMNSPASSARSTPKYAPLTVLQQSDQSRGQLQGTNETSSPPTRPSTTSIRRKLAMDYSPVASAPSSAAASPAIPKYSSLRVVPKQQRNADTSDNRQRSNSLSSPPSARRNILSSHYSPFSSADGASTGPYSTPKSTPPLGLHQRKRPQKADKDDVILGVDFVSTPPKTQRGAMPGLFSSLDASKPPTAGSAGSAARKDAAVSETNDGFQVPLSSPQTRKRTFLYHSPSPRTPVRPEASPLYPGSAASSAMSTPLPKITLTPRSCPSSANGRGGGSGNLLPSFPSPSDAEAYSSNFLVEQRPSNKRRCSKLAISHPSPSGEEDTKQLRGTFLLPRTRAQDGMGSEATSVDTPRHRPSFPSLDSDSARLSSLACKSSNSATEATESTTNSKHSSSLGSPSSRFLPQPRKPSYVPLPGGWMGDETGAVATFYGSGRLILAKRGEPGTLAAPVRRSMARRRGGYR